MIDIIKPRIINEDITDNQGSFVIEPLERGFGYTLGNTLRRVLISSLPGAAATWIRIDGITHEFTNIEGAKEDITDVILNIKQVVFRMDDEEPQIVKLDVKGPKEVTAGDLELPAGVEVINKDQYIFTLNAKAKVSIEIQVEKGRGYFSAERNKKANLPVGIIPIDSLFSPTVNATYNVENTRVGQRTDYDRLILNTKTNGSISPKEAVGIAAKIVSEHMDLFASSLDEDEVHVFAAENGGADATLNVPIEQIDFTVRSYNCLKRHGINTLEELINRSEEDLMNIRNFGTKSIDEIKDKLNQMGLSLKEEEQG